MPSNHYSDNSDSDAEQITQQQQQQQQQRSKKKVKYQGSPAAGAGGDCWDDEPSLPMHRSVSQTAISDAAAINNNNNNNNNNNQDESMKRRKTSFAKSDNHSDQDLKSNNTKTNDDNFGYSTVGSVVSDESGEHSNGSGDDDEYADGMHSSLSGSSGSSQGSKGLKSSIPCNKQLGCTIVHLMTISILVPITFLIVFTSIPLAESLSASSFLDKHRPVFTGIRNLGDYNLWERLNATFLIILDETDPAYAEYQRGTRVARAMFNAQVLDFTEGVMRESSLEDRLLFMRDLDLLMREIDVDREKIDSRTAFPPDYRDRQIDLINQMTRLLLYFAQDTRGELLRHRIVLYVLVRRIQNLFSSMLGSAVGVVNAGNDTEVFTSNIRALQSSFDSVISDLGFAQRSADRAIRNEIIEVRDSVNWNKWTDTVRILLNDNRSLYADIITEDNLTTWFNRASAEFDSVDRRVLNRITNGELLAAVALEAALMMAFALLSSCAALAVVVYYNNKEQKRMEKALDATAVLANAVQRFVPKNQLKTMGVRSITQVTPGMTTEVAQTITFSDIRGFTRLSESMTRLELFDWLQNYVARMTKVVSEEKSYIMAFLGDGLGICSPQPTYALNAAVKMHVSVEELNLNLVASGNTLPIKIGVGVNHGVVVAGVFGDANRLTCTMIAPDVNFASRLEALTKSFGVKILASESTIDHISPEVFCYRRVGRVQVAGSNKNVPVYDVYNTDDLQDKIMKDSTKKEFEHAVSIFESDPPEAVKIFESLLLRARMKGRSDECCEMYRKRFQTGGSSGASVLSFEKDGELRTAETSNLVNNMNEYSGGGFDAPSSPCGSAKLGVIDSGKIATHNEIMNNYDANNNINNNSHNNNRNLKSSNSLNTQAKASFASSLPSNNPVRNSTQSLNATNNVTTEAEAVTYNNSSATILKDDMSMMNEESSTSEKKQRNKNNNSGRKIIYPSNNIVGNNNNNSPADREAIKQALQLPKRRRQPSPPQVFRDTQEKEHDSFGGIKIDNLGKNDDDDDSDADHHETPARKQTIQPHAVVASDY